MNIGPKDQHHQQCGGDNINDSDELLITDFDKEPSLFNSSENSSMDSISTGINAVTEEGVWGCSHYKTNSKFRASCCGKWYPCRFCHDENENHNVDRHSTKLMMCLFCSEPQEAAKECKNCKEIMAEYYCDTCKFWDNEKKKSIFHCDKCGICRKGKREDYIHCDKCGGCVAKCTFNNHKCNESSFKSNCPICHEDMSTSIMPVQFMPCGHCMHNTCYLNHMKTNYQCPICLKSLCSMGSLFSKIDDMMSNQTMPSGYEDLTSNILCNDCETRSTAKFHFIYHKCSNCQSYNTKVLDTK